MLIWLFPVFLASSLYLHLELESIAENMKEKATALWEQAKLDYPDE